jgi:hypothetical protein
MCSSRWINSEELLLAKLGMEKQYSSGQMYGMVTSPAKIFFLRKIQQGKPLLWYFINIENKIQKEQKHQLKTEQAIPRGREETTLKGEGETNYLKVFTISKTRGFLEPSNL